MLKSKDKEVELLKSETQEVPVEPENKEEVKMQLVSFEQLILNELQLFRQELATIHATLSEIWNKVQK